MKKTQVKKSESIENMLNEILNMRLSDIGDAKVEGNDGEELRVRIYDDKIGQVIKEMLFVNYDIIARIDGNYLYIPDASQYSASTRKSLKKSRNEYDIHINTGDGPTDLHGDRETVLLNVQSMLDVIDAGYQEPQDGKIICSIKYVDGSKKYASAKKSKSKSFNDIVKQQRIKNNKGC